MTQQTNNAQVNSTQTNNNNSTTPQTSTLPQVTDTSFVIPRQQESQSFYHMICSAVRYSLGRRTYIVEDTVSFVISVLPIVPEKFLHIMLKDINECEDLGARMDEAQWIRLWEQITQELDLRNNNTL